MQPRSNSLIEQPASLKPIAPTAIYFALLVWMFAVLLVYLVLFGPPQFWFLAEKVGLSSKLTELRFWLQPFFTANYLSP